MPVERWVGQGATGGARCCESWPLGLPTLGGPDPRFPRVCCGLIEALIALAGWIGVRA
jgi:hypothetical protein